MNKNKKNTDIDMNPRINYAELNSGIDTSKMIDNNSKGKNEKEKDTK